MNLRKLLLVFFVTSLLIFLLQLVKTPTLVHPRIWQVQIFFFCTFLIGMRINQIGLTRPTKQFHIFYFSSMTIRFFLALGFMIFAVTYTKNQVIILICNFIVMYLLYTWFEIYFLIHNLRADLKKGDANS